MHLLHLQSWFASLSSWGSETRSRSCTSRLNAANPSVWLSHNCYTFYWFWLQYANKSRAVLLLLTDNEKRGKMTVALKRLPRTDMTCMQMNWWVLCCSRILKIIVLNGDVWLPCVPCMQERVTIGRKPESVADKISEGEVILTINVYYPAMTEKVSFHLHKIFQNRSHFTDVWCPYPPQFNFIRPHATLLMLGSHSLAELRDAICCVSDLQVCGEFSNTPDVAPEFISKVSRCAAKWIHVPTCIYCPCTAQHF